MHPTRAGLMDLSVDTPERLHIGAYKIVPSKKGGGEASRCAAECRVYSPPWCARSRSCVCGPVWFVFLIRV